MGSIVVMREKSKRNWLIISGSLISGVTVIAIGGLAASWAFKDFSAGIDQRLERACHRAVKRRAPFGHIDTETTGYRVEGEDTGIAEGVMMARYDETNWAKISWTCRINLKNGLVVRSEVKSESPARRARF